MVTTPTPLPGASLVRDFYLGKAARRGGIDGFDDALDVTPKARPLLPAENHSRDLTARKILLIAHVFVGGKQHIEPGLFRRVEQIAISEPVPTLLCRSADSVPFEIRTEWYRCRLIEKNKHLSRVSRFLV